MRIALKQNKINSMENQNNLPTTTPTNAITTTTEKTISQWYRDALPPAMGEALAIQRRKEAPEIGDIGFKGLVYAALAHKVTAMDSIAELAKTERANAVAHLSLRTMQRLLEEERKEGRLVLLREQYDVGVDTLIDQLALAYFGARVQADEDGHILHTAIADAIRRDYGMFSIVEIKEAFATMAKRENLKAYGKMTVQLLHVVLGEYKKARNRALSVLLDKEKQVATNVANLENIAAKNDAALEEAKNELADLAIENTRHASFYTCPHHFVEKMIKGGIIEMELEQKREILAEARQYFAHDIVNDAPNIAARKIANELLAKLNITPKQSPRASGISDLIKAYSLTKFDYADATPKQFADGVAIYYAKMIYFANCAPYQSPTKNSQNEKI